MTVTTSALVRLARGGTGYTLTAMVGGVAYQTSTLDWVSGTEGGAVATIVSRIDLAALRLGTTKVDDRIILTFDSRGTPREFIRTSGGHGIALTLDGERAHAVMHDGTELDVAADVSAVLDGNAPILTAILVALAAARGDRLEGRQRILIAGQLLAVDYGLKAAGAGRWQSTLDETLTIGDDGVVTGIEMATQGLAVRRATLVEIAALQVPLAIPASVPRRLRPGRTGVRQREIDVPLADGRSVAALVRTGAEASRGVALLIAGSGQIDRFGLAGDVDTGIGSLADALAHAGIAAMTADRHGAGRTPIGTDVLERGFDVELTTATALVGAAAGLMEPACAPVVIGHSLGGLTALAIAAQGRVPIAAVVLLATPGRPIDAVIEDQIVWIAQRRGLAPSLIAEQIAEHRAFMAAVRAGGEWSPATVPEKFMAQARLRPWLSGLLALHPVALIERVRVPIFIGQGDRDIQVSAVRDFAPLAAAAGPEMERRVYAGLDHMLKPADADAGIEDYMRADRAVDRALIADVVAFTRRHADRNAT